MIRPDPFDSERRGFMHRMGLDFVAPQAFGSSTHPPFTRPVGPQVRAGRVRGVPRSDRDGSKRLSSEPRHGSPWGEVPGAVGPRHNEI